MDLYDIFCAVLYVLKSGCQWRMHSSDFPKMSTVSGISPYGRLSVKMAAVCWKMYYKYLVKKVRLKAGRNEKTSFCILDAQSVKNTDTAEEKGYDAGKRYLESSGTLQWIPMVCPMRFL